MVVHTKHPVAAPPSAPPRETTGHLLLRGWCIFVIAAAVAGYFGLRARRRQATFHTNAAWQSATRRSQLNHAPLYLR